MTHHPKRFAGAFHACGGFSSLLRLVAAVLCTAVPALAAPQTPVARISLEAPQSEEFILSATLPVPQGEVVPNRQTSSLALVSRGQIVPTQVEIVSRYPVDSWGADVVELIARVERPLGKQPGEEIVFNVVRDDQQRGAATPTDAVAALLAQPDALRVTARDLFGNIYSADLLERVRTRHGSLEAVRSGRLIQECRSHEVMMPGSSSLTGAQAPYPHMLGVHVFSRVHSDEDFLCLDLVLHNGMSGRDAAPGDDPIHEVYFNQLDLHLPDGWLLGWAVDNPMVGDPVPSGAGTRVSLVEPLPLGQYHMVPQQAQFVRRLVVARGEDALARGMEHVERRTRGFCVPGATPAQASTNPADDDWSWWNEATARYLPSNARLPHMNYLPRPTVEAELEIRDSNFRSQVATGAKGQFPSLAGNLGWAQPWGVQFGGMTGGDEIQMLPAAEIAWARASVGLRWLDLLSKAYIDRHPVAIIDLDGKPPILEDHVVGSGNNAHVPAFVYLKPTGSDDYFGFQGAEIRFAEEAYFSARQPFYKKEIEDYQAIDLQHYTRYMSPLLGLVWLTNDSIARQQLELSASLFQLSFHQFKNSPQGHIQSTGLRQRMQDVSANPGQGAAFGRGEAWGLVAASAHYAIADPDERARLAPWFHRVVGTARDGQSSCSGNPTAVQINRNFKGAYQSRQSFEVGFLLNAFESIRTTVLDTRYPFYAGEARDFIVAGAYSTIEAPYWNDGLGGQVSLIAVRPSANDLPEFCLNIPENGYSQNTFVDRSTALPAWAYAYRFTNDGTFLQRAATSMAGGGNTEVALQSLGTGLLYEFAPFLALLQEL